MVEPWNKTYPWNRWFARTSKLTLWRGKDFDCMPHSMAQQVRNEALKRGVKVSITIGDDSLVVTNLGEA